MLQESLRKIIRAYATSQTPAGKTTKSATIFLAAETL